jgi:hypothetical protein
MESLSHLIALPATATGYDNKLMNRKGSEKVLTTALECIYRLCARARLVCNLRYGEK